MRPHVLSRNPGGKGNMQPRLKQMHQQGRLHLHPRSQGLAGKTWRKAALQKSQKSKEAEAPFMLPGVIMADTSSREIVPRS